MEVTPSIRFVRQMSKPNDFRFGSFSSMANKNASSLSTTHEVRYRVLHYDRARNILGHSPVSWLPATFR